jgi:predicted permease
MIRTLNALWNDLGFRPDNLLTFSLRFAPSMKTTGPEAMRASLRDLSDQLNSTPGVQAASFSEVALPLLDSDNLFFWLDGQPKPARQSEMNLALVSRVEPGYLAAMGIPLKRGRFFTAQDDERSQAVVVIDEVLARKYFPHEDPVGKRLNLEGHDDPVQIVGVVGQVKHGELDRPSRQAQLYQPYRQLRGSPSGTDVVVRAEAVTSALFDSIRRLVQSQNREHVIFGTQTMNEVMASSQARRRFLMTLLNAFAAAALLLASIGLYGVISYTVNQRTHELGIRLALGAERKDILRLVLSQGLKMALGGVALGLVAALGLTRLLESMLYGVSATDSLTFTVIAVLLLTVALLACYLPARRATRLIRWSHCGTSKTDG